MKPRHVAALALVGWYLLMPPWYRNKREPSWDAPISDWRINEGFETADECEDVRMYAKKNIDATTIAGQRAKASVCVSTDDPRLKEK
jgi:hypothetical protein